MQRRLFMVLLVFSGASLGVLAAHFDGVRSWIDAKLYIVAGVVCGYAAGAVLVKFLGGR